MNKYYTNVTKEQLKKMHMNSIWIWEEELVSFFENDYVVELKEGSSILKADMTDGSILVKVEDVIFL